MRQCGKGEPTERSGEGGMRCLYLLFEKESIIAMRETMGEMGAGKYEDLLIS